MNRHPLSACLPDISDEELANLAASIKTIGQQVPGVVLDGMILDGWHRYEACQIAGVKFKSVPCKAEDLGQLVKALNDTRRHMTANQRALSAVRLSKCLEEMGSRTECAGKKGGRALSAQERTEELAELADVSPRTIQYAKAAEAAGVGDAVLQGEVTAREAVAPKRKSKPKPKGDEKLVKQIMALEADLEVANGKVEALQEALADYDTLKADNENMVAVFEASEDKKLTTALATIKKQAAQIQVLEERLRSLQGERNMAIRSARKARK